MTAAGQQAGRTIAFVIPGVAVPKERARSRIIVPKVGKPFISVYTPAETRDYEERVKNMAWRVWGAHPPSTRPIELQLTVYAEIPPSWPIWKANAAVRGEIAPTSVPDLDNIEKAISDAMNGVVYVDDSQVCASDKVKLYATDGNPRIEVQVRENWRCGNRITRRDELELLR